MLADHFPLNDVRLWCWNVEEGYDEDASGDFVARRTCATFLMGKFSVPAEGRKGVTLSYSGPMHDEARMFFVERASRIVAFRTYPAVLCGVLLSPAVDRFLYNVFYSVCNFVSTGIHLSRDECRAVYMAVRRHTKACTTFLQGRHAPVLWGDADVITSAVYTCFGMYSDCRDAWMERGAAALSGKVDAELFMRELKRIHHCEIGAKHADEIVLTFASVCTWASPTQRASILAALNAMHYIRRTHMDQDLLNTCTALCTPPTSEADA